MVEIGKDIVRAKHLLEQGKLVAIPTETVYGLAGNALDVSVVTKIFSTKNRPHFDPLIVHVPDINAINHYAKNIPDEAIVLIKKFWPGPLTILLEKQKNIPDLVTSGFDRVGLRCPNHSLTHELLRMLSFPLAAPSANPFGYISPTKPLHVHDQLGDKIEYILDGGACTIGIESTILGFENNKPVVYRTGGLSVEDIESVIGEVKVNTHSSSRPNVPGQLQSHYAPSKPLIVGDIQNLLDKHFAKAIGVLSFQNSFQSDSIKKQLILSTNGSVDEAAQNLFSAMRELDQSLLDLIITEEVPNEGLGRAINDRLRRAATKAS